MRPGNREHVSHVAMHTPRTPLHLRPYRVQRYSSSIHKAMEEDSLMIRHDDDDREARSSPHLQSKLPGCILCHMKSGGGTCISTL